MTEHNEQLSKDDFKLSPLVEPSMPYMTFLQELKDHPERVDTAPGLILRCLAEMGVEKPEDEPDPERRLYLEMLRDLGIPSLNAFKSVSGSQRFQAQIGSFLANAAANGAQLYQMLIVEGGTGSGKDLFKDGMIQALIKHARVYAIKGCPEHENPLNLLKLDKVTDEHLQVFARKSGLGNKLFEMLRTASKPCQCCHKMVMGDIEHPNESPNFADVEVEAISLSPSTGGVEEWCPGQGVSLEKALRKAQRGVLGGNDFFLPIETAQGTSDERLSLLDVPQYRRLKGISADGCIDPPAPSPFDALIFVTTNAKAMSTWLGTIPDKEAFTSRCVLLMLRYNLVRVEEVRAYKKEMERYREIAHFDPLALKIIATLAVLSRFKAPEGSELFAHPIDKLRLYQGEKIQVKPLDSSKWSSYWATTTTSSISSSNPSARPDDKEVTRLAKDEEISTGMLWKVSGEEEGQTGLDMRFMLGLVSSINSIALRTKHKCIDAQTVMRLLTVAISNKLSNSNLTVDQKKTYERCLKWLGSARGSLSGGQLGTDKPELIESEYRRLLKEQFVRVFSPDYESRAQQLYEDYKLHAKAYAQGHDTVRHPLADIGQISVNTRLLDELDRYRLGKDKNAYLSEEDKKYRGGPFLGEIDDARKKFKAQNEKDGDESGKKFQDTWQTVPALALAISAKLDAEISDVMEKLLETEVVSNLSEDEQEKLGAAKAQLQTIGYCDGCIKPVLEYAKRTKVWSHKG